MFNTALNPAKLIREARHALREEAKAIRPPAKPAVAPRDVFSRFCSQTIKPFIRCRNCAEKLAQTNGSRLFEAGCGTYPLVSTLRKAEQEAHEPRRSGYEELRRQKDDERRRQEESLLAWAESKHDEACAIRAKALLAPWLQNPPATESMPDAPVNNQNAECGLWPDLNCCGGDPVVGRLEIGQRQIPVCWRAVRALQTTIGVLGAIEGIRLVPPTVDGQAD